MKHSIISFLKAALVSMMVMGVACVWAQEQGSAKGANQETQVSQKQTGGDQPEVERVNINTASLDELTTLPRVGKVIAQRIIDFRTENGNFKAPEEIMNVKGIGEKTFKRLAPLIEL